MGVTLGVNDAGDALKIRGDIGGLFHASFPLKPLTFLLLPDDGEEVVATLLPKKLSFTFLGERACRLLGEGD